MGAEKEKTLDEFKEETKSEAVEEVVHKMQDDPEMAETVAKSMVDHDAAIEAFLSDGVVAAKVTEHLLTDDAGLMEKVRGELEAEGFRIESDDDVEYDKSQAFLDYEVLAKATKHGEDPETIAKACGVPVTKTMQETDFSNAGLTIEERLLNEIVPILVPQAAFLDAGPVIIGMESTNKVGIGRQNQDPSSNWEDENNTISESDVDLEKLQLRGKKLTTAMAVSNDFLRRDSIITTEGFLAERMMVDALNTLEVAIFRGTGGEHQPQGLLTQVDSDHVNTTSGNTISDVANDAKEAKQKLEGEDVPDRNRVWFMRRDVFADFVFDINANEDTFPFRDELVENGTFNGDSVRQTNNIDLDGSSKSNIYYVEMSEQFVGRGTDFTLDSSEHQRFLDDETLLKQIGHWDYKMKHDKSAAVIEDYQLQSA